MATQAKRGVWSRIVAYRSFGILVALILLLIIAAIFTPSLYSLNGIMSMFRNNMIYAILGVGIMYVLISGSIDLSLSSIMALSGVVSTQLMIENPNVSIYVWVLVALVIGFACGTFNGLLTGKLGMHPMLATLGASYIYRGIAYIYHPVNFATPDIREEWRNLAVGRPVFGIYNIVLVAAFLFLFAFLFQTYTKPGRRIFASGSSPSSAMVSGFNPKNYKILAHAMGGLMAGVAGVMFCGNFSLVHFNSGDGYDMKGIAICVLGGVGLNGGSGRVDGMIISTVIISILYFFTSLLPGLSSWQDAFQGAIIVGAIIINAVSTRLAAKKALKERGALI